MPRASNRAKPTRNAPAANSVARLFHARWIDLVLGNYMPRVKWYSIRGCGLTCLEPRVRTTRKDLDYIINYKVALALCMDAT